MADHSAAVTPLLEIHSNRQVTSQARKFLAIAPLFGPRLQRTGQIQGKWLSLMCDLRPHRFAPLRVCYASC